MQTRGFRFALPLLLACAPALASEPTPPGPPQPPAGSVEYGGHHYLLVDDVEELSWTAAKEACERRGAHLAVISDSAEAEFVAELCAGRYMYLGASDHEKEGEWRWVDGSPWRYQHWMKGQPNDYSGSEDYLATYDDGEWVDVDHEGDGFWMPTGYICEWER